MRKYVPFLLLLLLLAPLTVASAAVYDFSDIYAQVDIPEDYILLTRDNLDLHPEWIARLGYTQETLLEDFQERGVLFQAWTREGDGCIELTAVKDALAEEYFDLDQQTAATRTTYRNNHTNGTYFGDQGYKFTAAEWRNVANRYGRFLELRYTHTTAAGSTQGYMRRTIRNGYTITLDYQAVGRESTKADSRALDTLMDTWTFTTTLAKPPEVAANLTFTQTPPSETNTGKFSVKGSGDAGLHIIGVVMRMSDPEPMMIETDIAKNGKFALDVQLPKEGVWLMTLTVLNGDTVTEEIYFDVTTYNKTLLPVNLDEPLPTTLDGNTLTISGQTLGQTTVICNVEGVYNKQVKTNNSGKFSFKISTAQEGEYQISLSFSKKNFDYRQFTATATRTFTEEDLRNQYREEAVKPAYSTLTQKLTGYTGRILHYDLYCVSIEPSGDQWLIRMAMNKSAKSGYRNILIVMADEAPPFVEDTQTHVYGRCTGPYEVIEEGESTTYPSMELLFWGK